MKKRLNIMIISIVALMIIFFVVFFIGNLNQRRIVLAMSFLFITYLLIYIFGGIGKLVSSLIYGISLALFLIVFPKYDTPLIIIWTFIFALNPLNDLEEKVIERFPTENSIIKELRGTKNAYYEYRKEIKNYYHLPQMRKIYNKPNYLKLRQAVSIILAMITVFLLLREVNNLANLLKKFDIHQFFASTYSIIMLGILTIILYKKGFQSMTNLLTVSVFPPAAYSMFFIVKPKYLGALFGSVIIVVGMLFAIYQYISFRVRITYESLDYYDPDKQEKVYANALFEPFIYNENYNLSVIFKIKITKKKFNKSFHNLIVYADFKKFFITAYTYKKNLITLYTEFHRDDKKKIDKLNAYLSNTFEESVIYDLREDTFKEYYEKEFFHNSNYIVARTIYLSEILKRLEIKSSVIASFVFYFNDMEHIKNIAKKYVVARVPELDMKNVYTIKIDLLIKNIDYIIENKVRELLLDVLVNKGNYVRVSVYY